MIRKNKKAGRRKTVEPDTVYHTVLYAVRERGKQCKCNVDKGNH